MAKSFLFDVDAPVWISTKIPYKLAWDQLTQHDKRKKNVPNVIANRLMKTILKNRLNLHAVAFGSNKICKHKLVEWKKKSYHIQSDYKII